MFLFGHLGFGSWLAKPFIGAEIATSAKTKKRLLKPGLPMRWVLLGCILPDLIDKPLYYGLSWMTGKRAAELGLISGTRTFGHTAIFAFTLVIASYFSRSKVLGALAIGVATHLLLDSVPVFFSSPQEVSNAIPLLWPFTGWQFPIYPYQNIQQHLTPSPYIWVTEITGAFLLALTYLRYYRKGKRRSE